MQLAFRICGASSELSPVLSRAITERGHRVVEEGPTDVVIVAQCSLLPTQDALWTLAIVEEALVSDALERGANDVVTLPLRQCDMDARISVAERALSSRVDDGFSKFAEGYAELLESGPVGIFEVQRDGIIRYANPALARLAGYDSPEQMIGQSILPHWEDLAEREALYRMLASGTAILRIKMRTRAGESRHILMSAVARGEMTRGISVDLTEARHTEQALEESLELRRRILEAMPGGVVHVRADGSIAHANAEACRVLGLAFDELTKKYTVDFETETIHEDGTACTADHYPVTRALTTGEAQPPHTIGVRKPDGEISWAVFTAVPVSESGGGVSGAVVTFLDITARKSADRRLRAIEEQMRHAQKLESLGLLAGGIAHDFNNLLTAILGNASFAKLKLPADASILESITSIETAAKRAADITRQMLTYSGRERVTLVPVMLEDLVREMAELLGTVVSKRATLEYAFAPEPTLIEGDPAQLQQIVMNLILNASDALGDASGVIFLRTGKRHLSRVDLSRAYLDEGRPEGEYAFLEVSDTGSGMDEATRSRVFDPFFSTKQKGRGLGLAASLGIVRSHRGLVELESTPGGGTTFCIYFPLPNATSAEVPRSSPRARPRAGNATVLVVDDELSVLDVTERLLGEFGYRVVKASSGRSALEMYRERARDIDVVLLDMTMKDMSGGEVLDQIVGIRRDARVILCSGYSEEDVLVGASAQKRSNFLQKPFTAAALIEAIERSGAD